MPTTELVGHSLAENEAIIEGGLVTFVEVGNALMEIRDQRQFVIAGFDTFEDYCRQRWDMSERYAQDHIGSARVCAIAHRSGAPVPSSEWVARPLVKVLNQKGEEVVERKWAEIVEAHGDGPITGKEVRRHLFGPSPSGGKPGWFELLGDASDLMGRADRALDKLQQQIADSGKEPHADLRANAKQYRKQALGLSRRLRDLAG